MLAPVGSLQVFTPEGGVAAAQAAKDFGTSTASAPSRSQSGKRRQRPAPSSSSSTCAATTPGPRSRSSASPPPATGAGDHGRHRDLQPPRTPHAQPLGAADSPRWRRHGPQLPLRADLGQARPHQVLVGQQADHGQGRHDDRRRSALRPARRRCRLGLQPRRPTARPRTRSHGRAARDRQGGRRQGRRIVEAASSAAPTSSRPSRLAPSASRWADCRPGASVPPARKAASACWRFSRTRSSPRWACSASRASISSAEVRLPRRAGDARARDEHVDQHAGRSHPLVTQQPGTSNGNRVAIDDLAGKRAAILVPGSLFLMAY